MKKNKSARTASVLFIAILLTMCIIGGTLAKYTTEDFAGDSARVAEFGVELQAIGSLYGQAYDNKDQASTLANYPSPWLEESFDGTQSVIANGVKNGTGGVDAPTDMLVAPGTKSVDKPMSFKLNGKPEVTTKFTNTVYAQDISLKPGTYGLMVPVKQDVVKSYNYYKLNAQTPADKPNVDGVTDDKTDRVKKPATSDTDPAIDGQKDLKNNYSDWLFVYDKTSKKYSPAKTRAEIEAGKTTATDKKAALEQYIADIDNGTTCFFTLEDYTDSTSYKNAYYLDKKGADETTYYPVKYEYYDSQGNQYEPGTGDAKLEKKAFSIARKFTGALDKANTLISDPGLIDTNDGLISKISASYTFKPNVEYEKIDPNAAAKYNDTEYKKVLIESNPASTDQDIKRPDLYGDVRWSWQFEQAYKGKTTDTDKTIPSGDKAYVEDKCDTILGQLMAFKSEKADLEKYTVSRIVRVAIDNTSGTPKVSCGPLRVVKRSLQAKGVTDDNKKKYNFNDYYVITDDLTSEDDLNTAGTIANPWQALASGCSYYGSLTTQFRVELNVTQVD